MATTIVQAPLQATILAESEIIFAVSNNIIVAEKPKVKFVANIHVSSTSIVSLSSATQIIGTFKTVPNNKGVGIFDLSTILGNYVKAENLAYEQSTFKGDDASDTFSFPMHLIDKFSRNGNSAKYFAIQFSTEYLDTVSGSATQNQVISDGTLANTDNFMIINGYLKYTDDLSISTVNNVDFGFDFDKFVLNDTNASFLSNAPTIQYASSGDYGTMALLNPQRLNSIDQLKYLKFSYYSTSGLLSDEQVEVNSPNGAYTTWNDKVYKQILYSGTFPGNLQNWNSTFRGYVTAGTIDYYTIQAQDESNNFISQLYTIYVICTPIKNFIPIRLTWLNQWGGWDYYTFKMKSSKTISTKGTTYNQLEGSWNEGSYRVDSFKGGKKSFRVNSTEKIKMNTDFISDDESTWFEEMINSPEIYILDEYQNDSATSALNKYVTPCRLTTTSYQKKTVANDKLIQYTFEIEKSKILRTQSI